MTRLLPHRRSTKFTILAAGGALCVATAASATAAAWPSASAAPPRAAALDAAAGLAGAGRAAASAHGATAAVPAGASPFQVAEFGYGARALDVALAEARAAWAREQAQQAAREHAAHAAHEKHLAALAAARAAQAAQAAAAQQQAAQQAQETTQQQAPSAASGSPQQIAESMLAQYGWSGQFSCLDSLWTQESDWNVYAENPGSGAYGIPQAVPGSKMASAGPDWQSDAATQIEWGLEYIQSTYGSPCAAWAHEEADGWY